MSNDAKHKSQRSVSRLFGQSVDANGNVTGAPVEVRIAYPFLHTKRTKSAAGDPLDKPRFDAVLLVPKLAADATQCPNYAALWAHCSEASFKAWGSWPQGGKLPIQDGDIPHAQKLKPGQTPLTPEQITERNKWRAGHWVVEVTNYSDTGPKVNILQNGQAVEIPAQTIGGTELYKSGDYGYVWMCAYSFHNKTFGVNFGFEGVLFTRPGEKIGQSGPRSSASMFGSVAAIGAPVRPTTTPAPVATPPMQPTTNPVPVATPAPVPSAVTAPAPTPVAPPVPPVPVAVAVMAPPPAVGGLPPIPGR